MADERKLIKVGSRKSQLALIQTRSVISMLKEIYPNYEFEIETFSTTGDNILNIALSKIGEKALFTKELEIALEERKVDFLVHSLKDLPTVLPEGMAIGAVCKRDPPEDAIVMHKKHSAIKDIADLPPQSVLGTSSLRRQAQAQKYYPHLIIKDVRGNLNTRLSKLDNAEDYDCLMLAQAGLERMDWQHRSSQVLGGEQWLYAVSQGAMAVECRAGDEETLSMLAPLNHAHTLHEVVAERAFLKTLEGGCSVPVGVYSNVSNDGSRLLLKGGVFSTDGAQAVIDSVTTSLTQQEPSSDYSSYSCVLSKLPSLDDAEKLGVELAHKLIEAGAGPILDYAKAQATQAATDHAAIKAAKMATKTNGKDAELNGTVKANGDAKNGENGH